MREEVIYNLDTRSFSSRVETCTKHICHSRGKRVMGKVVFQPLKLD